MACYVEFIEKDEATLSRTVEFFGLLKAAKESENTPDESDLKSRLNESELKYFWDPSPEEKKEWDDHWISTPVNIRLSPSMKTPPWHFESMLEVFWQGEYDLDSISRDGGSCKLRFTPHAYPFGGTGCMVALLECFGHRVIGTDDGTGYVEYIARTPWRPKKKKWWNVFRKSP